MAEWTGLEPAAFRVTGGRYNQLNYHSAAVDGKSRSRNLFKTLPAGNLENFDVAPSEKSSDTFFTGRIR